MTAALHFRALDALPEPLAALCRAHPFPHELGELVQEAALAMLEQPGATAQQIYKRARSRLRRYTQNPAYYGTSYSIDDLAAPEPGGDEPPTPTRKQIRAQIQSDLGVSTRDAQRMLKKQLERMRENGDLFVADESGVLV